MELMDIIADYLPLFMFVGMGILLFSGYPVAFILGGVSIIFGVLGFGALMVLIVLVGVLIFGIGLLVAAPVVICSLVAAYQHLFGSEDRTGFLQAN